MTMKLINADQRPSADTNIETSLHLEFRTEDSFSGMWLYSIVLLSSGQQIQCDSFLCLSIIYSFLKLVAHKDYNLLYLLRHITEAYKGLATCLNEPMWTPLSQSIDVFHMLMHTSIIIDL